MYVATSIPIASSSCVEPRKSTLVNASDILYST